MAATLSHTALLGALNGSPTYVGTISSSGAHADNADGTPFDMPQGAVVMLVADAAGYFAPLTSAAGTVTTANGVPLAASSPFYFRVRESKAFLGWISATGTAALRVFRMD
jgi:hypothetical protein